MKTSRKQGWELTFTEIPLYFSEILAMELSFSLLGELWSPQLVGIKGVYIEGLGR